MRLLVSWIAGGMWIAASGCSSPGAGSIDAAAADTSAVDAGSGTPPDARPPDAPRSDAGPTSYATSFDATESPLFEDGRWRQGGRDGLDWQDVRSEGGLAFGSGSSPDAYDDCIAVRDDAPTSAHTVRATIHRDPGFSPAENYELEVITGATIEAHDIRVYEVLWSVAGNFQIARWDGALGMFDVSIPLSGAGPGEPADGDVLEVSYDATDPSEVVITVRKNGVEVAVARDASSHRLTSGNPGLSFFSRAPTGAEMNRYCFSDWSYTVP